MNLEQIVTVWADKNSQEKIGRRLRTIKKSQDI